MLHQDNLDTEINTIIAMMQLVTFKSPYPRAELPRRVKESPVAFFLMAVQDIPEIRSMTDEHALRLYVMLNQRVVRNKVQAAQTYLSLAFDMTMDRAATRLMALTSTKKFTPEVRSEHKQTHRTNTRSSLARLIPAPSGCLCASRHTTMTTL